MGTYRRSGHRHARPGSVCTGSHQGEINSHSKLSTLRETFSQEFIKVRGFQVAPAELEGSLLGHPDIIDCCVVGVEDERSGEVPLAYVVLSADAKKRSLEGPQMASDISESIQHVRVFFLYLFIRSWLIDRRRRSVYC